MKNVWPKLLVVVAVLLALVMIPATTLAANVTVEGIVEDPGILLTVAPETVSFGNLLPGESSAIEVVTLTNGSTIPVRVDVVIGGTNPVFYQENLEFRPSYDFVAASWDSTWRKWNTWETRVGASLTKTVDLRLTIPNSYTSYGTKSGTLTFWAEAITP